MKMKEKSLSFFEKERKERFAFWCEMGEQFLLVVQAVESIW